MRIAFFGGTFDPPHRGHLAIALAAIERLRLDRVLVAPVGAQPLKRNFQPASFEDRMAMVKLAFAGDERFVVSDADRPHSDGSPNYTVDVLRELKRDLVDGDKLFCLLGADSFLTMKHWHRAAELLFVCSFIVAGRPGFSLTDLTAALPEGVCIVDAEANGPFIDICALENAQGQRSNLYLMPDLQEDVSATQIRAALSGDAGAEKVLSPEVVRYIDEHGLYR